MDSLKELFTNKDGSIKFLKKNFPRVIEAEIRNEELFIFFYGNDDIEKWLDDYKNLDSTLKKTFQQFYKDKQYFIRVITAI